MAPPISFAMIELPYPVFAAEFDPYNRGFLLVGGGGGESKTGVANKLTLLDVSSHAEVASVAEIDLSREEDSVQSIASLATRDGLITFAGINGSLQDQKAGKNEHLRSFSVAFPRQSNANAKAKAKQQKEGNRPGEIKFASKSSLFRPAPTGSLQPYQRLTRLSPIADRETSAKRVGAIATGLADQSEIVLLDATSAAPTAANAFASLKPTDGSEAVDMDLATLDSDDAFSLAYCTDYEVSRYTFKFDFKKKKHKPDAERSNLLYAIPKLASSAPKSAQRPALRALRWIGPENLLLLQNTGGRGGRPELLVLHVPTGNGKATVIRRQTLPRAMQKAIDLDICILDADPGKNARQIVIAVVGKDISIHILKIDHDPSKASPSKQFSALEVFSVLRDVHPTSITSVAFSKFFPPRQPEGSNMSVATFPQYIQLASTSLGGSVVVESLELTSTPTSPSNTADVPGRRKVPAVRWVLASSGNEFMRRRLAPIVIAFVVLMIALAAQRVRDPVGTDLFFAQLRSRIPYMEPPGAVPPHLRAAPSQPVSAYVDEKPEQEPVISVSAPHEEVVRVPVLGEPAHTDAREGISELHPGETTGEPPVTEHAPSMHRFRDFLALHQTHHADKHLVIRPQDPSAAANGLAASIHDNDAGTLEALGAKKFEDLTPHEQAVWKQRLEDAGHWSEGEGETILKSIFFSQVADILGGAIRDAILH